MMNLSRLFQNLYSKSTYRITARPSPQVFAPDLARPPHWDLQEVTVKVAEEEDFRRLARQIQKFTSSTRLADRARRGDLCFVAYKKGALAHFRWVALTDPELPELGARITLHLDPDEAYTYDSYTLPAFRRQGIAFEARKFLTAYLSQRGIHTLYSMGRSDNPDTQEHLTFRERHGAGGRMGAITVLTVLGSKHLRFYGETREDCQRIARLFRIPSDRVHRRPA